MDVEEHDALLEWIERLQAIRATIAPAVIAGDLRNGDDWTERVVRLLGDAHLLEDIQALDDRLHEAGQETTVPMPTRDDPDYRQHLGNAAVALGVAWGQAGYLIGLAVGMQLGPDAFDSEQGRGR